MARNTETQIKQDEKKILEELSKNANSSINEIANKLGFSRQKVWRIIKNLEKDKTIWGYTAIVDDDKIGLKRFCILLKKANAGVTDEKLGIVINRELRETASKNEVNLESTYFFNGSYDGQICVTAENILQVKKFIADMQKKLGTDSIKEADILEVLFPIQMMGFNNPNLEQLRDYFSLD
jgi:DNA-binding Lrp family transcriptional regulator